MDAAGLHLTVLHREGHQTSLTLKDVFCQQAGHFVTVVSHGLKN